MDIFACGDVIITDLALIVIAPNPTKARAIRVGAAMAGGVVGSMLVRISSSPGSGGLLNLFLGDPVPPLAHMKSVTTCWPSEVPEELAGLHGWPRISLTRPLTFCPRAVIGAVRLSWTGQMTIRILDIGPDVDARVNFWQVSKAKSHLRRAGYRLE